MKLKILSIVGARPNLVKIAPLLREMASRPGIESYLVHTGQHYDIEMSQKFFEDLQIPEPDINLEVGSGTHAEQTAQVMRRLEPVLIRQKPDCVVVVGDVNSTFAGAYVARKLGVPVAHVEAGLRSFDRTMPEEINRILTDAIADYLFITEPSALKNLRHEGIPRRRIFFVGNVMIDSLKLSLKTSQATNVLKSWGLVAEGPGRGEGIRPYAVLTLHRPSNVDEARFLNRLLAAIRAVSRRVPVIFPVHPRTAARLGLSKAAVRRKQLLGRESGLRVVPPLGYLEFVHLVSRAAFVMTDSGGIQEETTFLGVPCLTLRDTTERPITITQGTNRLIGRNPDILVREAFRLLEGKPIRRRIPRLWDGRASKRIINVMLRELPGRRSCD
jgi:UDP-N-acetylglucosamine 2-epimerase (non-hydrolysing)